MNMCKTCKHWQLPRERFRESDICSPLDPDTYKPMQRGFEVRICRMPTQTFSECPTEINGFGLADGSDYYAVMATAEGFGCVRHEPAECKHNAGRSTT